MPYTVPSTQELTNRNIAQIEAALNANTPPAERAFNRVLSVTKALAYRQLYSFAEDRVRENFALTASESGLESMGVEYGIRRVQPTAWEGVAQFDIPDSETLFLGTIFIGAHGLRYKTKASVTAPTNVSGEGVFVPVACIDAGPSGNLSVNDTLAIQAPIAGAGRTAIVIEVTALGMPAEDLESYRQRLLDFIRSEGGGGNSSDYRTWAQAVPGVRRAYPFSGPPETETRIALPGERTVYIESTQDINSEGIPPQSLLDLVQSALLVDPVTGISREILGLTRDTLYVRPIVRTGIYVSVIGMIITNGSIGDAETAVENALITFIESFAPFVQGLDPDFDRRDVVTGSIIGREVQNVLDAYGGTAQNVVFGVNTFATTGKYYLRQNEKLKLTRVTFQGTGATNA